MNISLPLPLPLPLLLFLFFCFSFTVALCTVPVSSAYLPVRRSYHRTSVPSSAVVPLSYHDEQAADSDDKRTIAKRLLRNAASHRRNSLRDVLSHTSRSYASGFYRRLPSSRPQSISAHPHVQPHAHPRADPTSASTNASVKKLHAAADHMFTNRQNSTRRKYQRPPISLHVNIDNTHQQRQQRQKKQRQQRQQRQEQRSNNNSYTSAAEQRLLLRSVAALKTNSAATATAALRTVEELCHSIHNGQALERQTDGFQPILNALNSRHRRVRASAAWAVATCSQNNRPVQKALLDAGAVTTLARLAVEDVLNVRARALFALNALVGMEEARIAFEKLPYATQVVMAGLKDTRDYRATRRALNLAELLVRKNLDAWKTQLEAWDVPLIIENLLRHHPNIDVRESAARIITALDGN